MAKANGTGTADVLTLSTTEWDRPTIAIDGKRYVMRSPDELTVPMLKEMISLGDRIGAAQGNLDDLDGVIGGGIDRVMVDLPQAVRSKLTLGQQSEILSTFTRLAGWAPEAAKGAKATTRRAKTGGPAKSSRSQKRSVSTAAHSATG